MSCSLMAAPVTHLSPCDLNYINPIGALVHTAQSAFAVVEGPRCSPAAIYLMTVAVTGNSSDCEQQQWTEVG
jgi:hypothetical protein